MPSARVALLWLVIPTTLIGCASNYAAYYKQTNGATPEAIATRRATPPPRQPIVEHASFRSDLLDDYAKLGYAMIGESSFNSGRNESDSAAIAQAKHIGADLVLILTPRSTGTVTTSMPLTLPTSSTSVTNGSATAYGAGGTVNAYGTSTTTTYGNQTTYIPLTIHRADYGAAYFVKQKFSLGAYFRDLNDAERRQLQSNHGAVIQIVVNDTPAFAADLLSGDIVTDLDGTPVSSSAGLSAELATRRGQPVKMSVLRNSQHLEKIVTLAQ